MPLDGEAFRGPDAKPTRQPRKPTRIIEKKVTTKACLEWRECPCGKPSATGHHVISRAQGGDDVLPNIIPLCGSGTTGCHGLVENNDVKTLKMVGRWVRKHRPDTVAYVRGKLGYTAGNDWLRRHLYSPDK